MGAPINKSQKIKIGCGSCLLVTGFILIILGAVLPGISRNTFNSKLLSPKLDKDSAEKAHGDQDGLNSYEKFSEAGTYEANAANMDYYIPNVTNADKVLSEGAAPIIVDIGPFAFKHLQKKYEYGNSGDNYSWKSSDSFKYDESQSCKKNTHPQSRNGKNWPRHVGNCDSLDDVLTTPNVVYYTLLRKFKQLGGDEAMVPLFSTMVIGNAGPGPHATSGKVFLGTAQNKGMMDSGDTTTSSLLDNALNVLAVPAMVIAYHTIVDDVMINDDLGAANKHFVDEYFTASSSVDHGNISYVHGAKMASSVLEDAPADISQKFSNKSSLFESLWHPEEEWSITFDGSAAKSIAEGSATVAMFLEKASDSSPNATLRDAVLQTVGGTRWLFLTLVESGTFPVLGGVGVGSIADELRTQIANESDYDAAAISLVVSFFAGAIGGACRTLSDGSGTCVDNNGLGSSIARLTCPLGACTPLAAHDSLDNRALCAAHQWPNSDEVGCGAQEASGVKICGYSGTSEPALPGFECNPTSLSDIAAIQSATGAVVKRLGLLPGDERDQVEMSEVVEARSGTDLSLGFKLDMFSSMQTYSQGKAYMSIAAARQVLKLMRGEYDVTARFAPGGAMVDAFSPANLEGELRTELLNILDNTVEAQREAFLGLALASLGESAATYANDPNVASDEQIAAALLKIRTDAIDKVASETAGALSAKLLPLQPKILGGGKFFQGKLGKGLWAVSNGTSSFPSDDALGASMANMFMLPRVETVLLLISAGLKNAAASIESDLSTQLSAIGQAVAISVAAPSLCGHITQQALGVALNRKSMKAAAHYIVDDLGRSVFNNIYKANTMSGPFVTRTARELLITGYKEPVFEIFAKLLRLPVTSPPPIVKPQGEEGLLADAEITASDAMLNAPCSDPSDAASKTACDAKGLPQTKPTAMGVWEIDTGKANEDYTGTLVSLDGSSAIAGKCVLGCWNASASLLAKTEGGSENVIPALGAADAWKAPKPQTPPTLDMIEEDWNGDDYKPSDDSPKLPMVTWLYSKNHQRGVKLEYKNDVTVPANDGEIKDTLKLRRFTQISLAPGNHWRGAADAAIAAEGLTCAVDMTAIKDKFDLFVGSPHLNGCNETMMAASTKYTMPIWNTDNDNGGFDPGDLATHIDIEPHTGMFMRGSSKLAAFAVIDSSALPFNNGGVCGEVGAKGWPFTVGACKEGVVKDIIVPIFWAHRHGTISPEQAYEVLGKFELVRRLTKKIPKILLALGFVIALGATGILVWAYMGRASKSQHIAPASPGLNDEPAPGLADEQL